MNLMQIEYFLEIARCKSISTAAKHLYITQPTLSRQITTIERELNMQLFIRNNKGLRLSPAGTVLYEELSIMMSEYRKSLKKAHFANIGSSDLLTIGVVEGLDAGLFLPDMIEYFEKNHPNIGLILKRLSFKALVDGLLHDELDIGISFDFNFYEQKELLVKNICEFHPAFAVPIRNPLSKKEVLTYKDFEKEDLVVVEEEECSGGINKLIEKFRTCGGFYPNFYFVDSMANAIFWVEAGMKCALLNMEMSIAKSSAIKMFPIEDELKNYMQIAKKKSHENFASNLAMNYFSE